MSAAEKEVIVKAVETMISGIRQVLEESGFEVQEGRPFDLSTHGIVDEQGKVRHSDSQRVLEDPEAIKAYKGRSAKALWNFAVTLKSILVLDAFVDMAKLGLSKSDYLKANIGYLDSRHLDDQGNEKENHKASNAILIVDPNTLVLAQSYRNFLTVVADNKEAILKILPWLVQKLAGSLLNGALGATDEIKASLSSREREFEQIFMTHLHPTYVTLNQIQPFFIVLESTEQEIQKIISDIGSTTEKKLAVIQKLKKDVLDNDIDKEAIEAGIRDLEKAKKDLSSKTLNEIEIDLDSLIAKFDADMQLLKNYLEKYDETVIKRQSVLQQLEETEKDLQASLQEGKRSTPMKERPDALRAQLDALLLLDQEYDDAQYRLNQIRDEMAVIKLRAIVKDSPLKNVQDLDKKKKLSLRFQTDKFKQLVKELGLSKEKVKELEIVCDLVVIRAVSEKKKLKAWDELVRLVAEKIGKSSEKPVSIKYLENEEQSLVGSPQKIEVNLMAKEVLTKKLNETIQREIADYKNKVDPMLISAEMDMNSYNAHFKSDNFKDANICLKRAEETVKKINQLRQDYEDCRLEKNAPEEHMKINDLIGEVETSRKNLYQRNNRQDFYNLYFGNQGFAVLYLEKLDKKSQGSNKSGSKYNFFKISSSDNKIDTEFRDFVVKIANKVTNYVESGDHDLIREVLSDIDAVLEEKIFNTSKRGNKSNNTMENLLSAMKMDIEKRLPPNESSKPQIAPE